MTDHTPTPRTEELDALYGILVNAGSVTARYRTALIAAERELAEANRSLAKGTTWIPVSERLPEEGQLIVAHFTQEVHDEAFYDAYNYRANDDLWSLVDVWMPLPEAPK